MMTCHRSVRLLSLKQWAAVRTWLEVKRLPAHSWTPEYLRLHNLSFSDTLRPTMWQSGLAMVRTLSC